MPPELSQHPVLCLLEKTECMLAAAEAGNWEAVEVLERERDAELDNGFSQSVATDSSRLVSDGIAALIVLNDRLIQCVAQERSRVLQEGQSLRQGRTASASYASMQSAI